MPGQGNGNNAGQTGRGMGQGMGRGMGQGGGQGMGRGVGRGLGGRGRCMQIFDGPRDQDAAEQNPAEEQENPPAEADRSYGPGAGVNRRLTRRRRDGSCMQGRFRAF